MRQLNNRTRTQQRIKWNLNEKFNKIVDFRIEWPTNFFNEL